MKKGTSKFLSVFLVMVLLLNMTLVVNAADTSPYMYYEATLDWTSSTIAKATMRTNGTSVSLSGSAYSSLEGVSDTLYASGYTYASDSTYSAVWSSVSCNYYANGDWVASRAL